MGIVDKLFIAMMDLGLKSLVLVDFADTLVGKPDITLGIDTSGLGEFFPLVGCHLAFLYRTPLLAITVESAVARDGYVVLVAG